MQPFDSIDRLEELASLDPVISRVRSSVRQVIQPQALRDLLHGVWLGHPLHPMLVQVPIGAWTSAAILDLVPKTGPSVSLLIGTGMATAAPAAAAGLVDWSELNQRESRMGLVHAAANSVALVLYGASLLARARGRRARGKALGYAGLASVMVGGLIGGHLSYRNAAGVNHNADAPALGPTDWTDVGRLDELPDGQLARRDVGTFPILLLRRGMRVSALADRCSHLSGPLSEGQLTGDGEPCVVCPWHGSTFRIADGTVVHGPATAPQPMLETRVLSDHVEVRLAQPATATRSASVTAG